MSSSRQRQPPANSHAARHKVTIIARFRHMASPQAAAAADFADAAAGDGTRSARVKADVVILPAA